MFKIIVMALTASTLVSFVTSANPSDRSSPPCGISHPSDSTVLWECRKLGPGESLESLFGEQWEDVARFNRIDRRHARSGAAIKAPKRIEDLMGFTPLPLFYSEAERDEQFLLIDLREQFLGAYEYGALRFAMPITSGNTMNETPPGEFRLTDAHRTHLSCLYTVTGSHRPYPMNYALRFYVNREGVSYWIHGRDLPGYPASHGCIGLYDEPMQKKQYGFPQDPELSDAERLFLWVLGTEPQDNRIINLPHGPRVHIIGRAPSSQRP